MAKKNQKSYIEFVGYNSTEVTGSANLVRFLDDYILIDYGMRQTSNDEDDYKINRKRHKSIKPKALTAIILTHLHNDHCGLIPTLYRDGANCPLYIPQNSKGLLTLMLQDSVHIFEKEYELYNKTPLFNQNDVDLTLKHVKEVDLYELTHVNDNISFTYYYAQHIVKSRQVLLELKNNTTIKRIGFTGDFSSYKNRYFLLKRDTLPHCNIVIGESTYSNKNRINKENKDKKKDIDKIHDAIQDALSKRSKIIVPVFSLDRLEIFLATLYDTYDGKCPIKIFVDTPLGYQISKLWDILIDKDFDLWNKIKNWDNVYWNTDFSLSQRFNMIQEPLMVLAGGGMLQGGRSRFWVKENLNNKDNIIMFCGFSTPNSLAGQIKEGKNYITIDNQKIKNKSKVVSLNSFSCHADYQKLMEYYVNELKYEKICLVHGEMNAKINFAEDLKKNLSKSNRTSRVVCVTQNTKIHL